MVKTIVGVDGMMCGMCESHVNEAVRNAFPIKKVSSSHGKKQTEIISEESLDHEKLKAAIEKTGYQVTSVTEEPYKKKGFSLFGRWENGKRKRCPGGCLFFFGKKLSILYSLFRCGT